MADKVKKLERVKVWSIEYEGADLYLHEYGEHGIKVSKTHATKDSTVTFIPYHAVEKIEHRYEEIEVIV
jgi:hypothetical protein